MAAALAVRLSFETLASANPADDPGRVAENSHLTAQATFPEEDRDETPSAQVIPDTREEQLENDLSRQMIDMARDMVATHLEIPSDRSDDILLACIESVTWPDTRLGCPKEGMAYTAVVRPGFRLDFGFERTYVSVHLSDSGRYGIIATNCLSSMRSDAVPSREYRGPETTREELPVRSERNLEERWPISPMAEVILTGSGLLRVRVSWEPPFPSGCPERRRGGDGNVQLHEPYADVEGYIFIRRDGRTFEVEAPLTMITDPNGQHEYTAIAQGDDEKSLPSVPAQIRTPHTPAAPRVLGADVSVSPSGDRETVLLNSPGATAPRPKSCVVSLPVQTYRLQRTVGGDAFLPPGDPGPDATTFTDTEVRRNETHTYRLLAVNAVRDSPAPILEVSVP